MPLNYEQAKDQIANEAGYPNFLTALKDRMEPTNRYTVTELINKAAELYADSVARDAWNRACEATLLKIKTTFTDPKNLDKCDNVAILLRDAVKEIGSDMLSFPKPEYQPK